MFVELCEYCHYLKRHSLSLWFVILGGNHEHFQHHIFGSCPGEQRQPHKQSDDKCGGGGILAVERDKNGGSKGRYAGETQTRDGANQQRTLR